MTTIHTRQLQKYTRQTTMHKIYTDTIATFESNYPSGMHFKLKK